MTWQQRIDRALDERRAADALRLRLPVTHDAGRWLAAQAPGDARDVRLRVALQHTEHASAQRLVREVTALYCCGPAGGGGVRTAMRPRLGTVSCLVPRAAVTTGFTLLD